jgi:hypothetical protein
MERIAFDFDDVPVPVLGQHAAAGRALPTGGGVPGGFTGDDIFRGKDIGDKVPIGLIATH